MKGWQTKTLDQISTNLDSRRVPITKADRVSGEYPYYGASGIVDYVADYIFDEDTLLISEDGANLLARSTPIAFPATGKYWVNNHAHIVRFENLTTQRFVELFLESIPLDSYITGAAQPKLNQTALNSIPIPVPPLPEQRRIVGILDEAFDGIATAKANAEKNLQNARAIFESHLQSVFTQSGKGWVEKRLDDVCAEITVGHVGSMATQYKEGGIPFLRSQNIRPFFVSLDNVVFIDETFHRSLAKSQLRPGDVAVVRTGYPGTAAVVPESLPICNCSDLVIVRPGPTANPHYLALFFNSTVGKELVAGRVVGAAQKHFNVTAAKQVSISFPPVHEQSKVVAKLDAFRVETQRLESVYQRKLAALEALKKSLLHQAFTGELTQ